MGGVVYKTGNTFPSLQVQLTEEAGVKPLNLTSATSVKLKMYGTKTKTFIEGLCEIVKASEGKIAYNWGGTDLAVADVYEVEFLVLWSAGGIESVPNEGTNTIEVQPALV